LVKYEVLVKVSFSLGEI